ncbi:FAD-dependent oxidoreductase [Acuticoccus sediminis]|uniref:FAD-dependent oxidoreductase n=1 Tax=Acuticoccus sediminis TaxID=2184697 RepID=A0A8B2NNE0_9HYPH|nr:FAD-dependent oxidoreductase [Acuticoccus sediminis]RAH98378.1 FAD-dependent oxidoreductase [Acuticoccus sediminis]
MTGDADIVVVGGGILGCAAALRLAEGGMKPLLIEAGDVGQGASGVNAGTLSLQIKRVGLMDYALRGHREWESYGPAVGFRRTGGYTLAFTDSEADLLHARQRLKREAGAPIEFVAPATLAAAEPGLSDRVVAASFCPLDGDANSSLTGRFFRGRLREAGIPVHESAPVRALRRTGDGFAVETSGATFAAPRLLLAAGAWLKPLAAMLDVDLPVHARVNTVTVTERSAPLIGSVIGHATGLLTMKQKANGSILVGGGWQGRGTPQEGRGEALAESVAGNLALASFVLPALGAVRIVRSWTGFEAHVPDFYPLAGALPCVPNAFVLGCVRGGYTIGPYIGRLMGDFILGREPELPLFDPGRPFPEPS